MNSDGQRLVGMLSSWNDERGFGFIVSAANGAGIFVHISAFPWSPMRPHVGEQLTFEIEVTSEGKRQATSVRRPRRPRVIRGAVASSAIVAFVLLYVVVGRYWTIPGWVTALYLGVSAICYLAYATDKAAARAGRWRVSESSLLALGRMAGRDHCSAGAATQEREDTFPNRILGNGGPERRRIRGLQFAGIRWPGRQAGRACRRTLIQLRHWWG